MSDIITASGSRFFISGSAITSDVDTLAEFEATSVWTELGLIESIGVFGDKASDVTFAALSDGRMRHAKGVRDAGTIALVVAHDPADAGQIAFSAASDTNNNYGFKVIVPDGPTPAYSDTILYFRGLVNSQEYDIGANDHVVRRNFAIGINSAIVSDPAST